MVISTHAGLCSTLIPPLLLLLLPSSFSLLSSFQRSMRFIASRPSSRFLFFFPDAARTYVATGPLTGSYQQYRSYIFASFERHTILHITTQHRHQSTPSYSSTVPTDLKRRCVFRLINRFGYRLKKLSSAPPPDVNDSILEPMSAPFLLDFQK